MNKVTNVCLGLRVFMLVIMVGFVDLLVVFSNSAKDNNNFATMDTSRICFNALETMAPSRGWQLDRNAFTVISHIQP